MNNIPLVLSVAFYRTEAGNEPVRDWLMELPRDSKKLIGTDIKSVQLGWPQGMPLVRKLEHRLWEVRTDLGENAARVIFTLVASQMVLLHGFIKKSQKTPLVDLNTAKHRKTSCEEHPMNKHIGSNFDDFLSDDGLIEEVSAGALKRVIAWQLAEAMKAQKVSKKALAERMHTSRTAVDRALDQNDAGMTLSTLASAARALGQHVEIRLVSNTQARPARA